VISHCETVSSGGCGLSSSCPLHMMRVVMPIRPIDSACGLAQGRLAALAEGSHLLRRAGAAIAGLALVVIAAGRSGLASDFITEGVDSARTGWVRDESVFTTANVANTRLLWRLGLESTPRAMHNLFAPLVAQRVDTPQGMRELAVVAGVSDDLFGIDVATGRQIWHRHFDSTLANPGGTSDTLCPGGQTAVPTMAQISPGKYTIYAVSWDGRLRQVNLADGQDIAPPQKFIPGGGKPYALNLHDGVVNTTPMAFDAKGSRFLVGTSKECRLWLLDRDALGGEDHRTTLHTTPLICNDAQAFDAKGIWGALGAWQDGNGTQWVLAPFWGPVSKTFKAPIEHARPTGGGVAAFTLQQRPEGWQLTPAWLSRDMDLADEAVIANGVVFAYAAGEDASQTMPDKAWNEPGGPVYGGGLSSGPVRRVPASRRAALYALDGQTGKELWSSGRAIESWNHFSGLTVANGRVYLATFDGVLYCFGIPQ